MVSHVIDLDTGQLNTVCGQYISEVVQGNSLAMTWQVVATKSGQLADLSGCKCAVKAVRADGATVPVEAQMSDSNLSATLTGACFAVIGKLDLFFDVMDSAGNVIMTVSQLHLTVKRGGTPVVVPPGDTYPDLSVAIAALTQSHVNCAGIVDVSRQSDAQYTVSFDSGQTYSVAITGDDITIEE